MSVNVSAPVKIFALVGVLAAVVLGGGMMFLGGGVEAEPTAVVLPKQAGVVPAAPAKPAVKPAVKPVAKVAPAKPAKPAKVAKPAKAPLIAANGLPNRLVSALRHENVVVLALWGTGGKIDRLALDEAAAGAASAGVGFVALNVMESNREAEALTLKLGVVLRAPTVLFFTGSDTLAVRLDGFRDRETVAQAALDALR